MGQDKASLPFGSETMLQRIVTRLSDVVTPSRIVVVASENQVGLSIPSSIRITHDRQAGQGPLEGMAVGWDACHPDVNVAVVVSCDVPLIVPAFVNRLFELSDSNDAVVPWDGQWLHPLTSVYRRTVRPHIETLLQSNQLRVNRLFEHVNTCRVPVETLRDVDPQMFSLMNVNDPETYQMALRASSCESGKYK